MIQDIAVRKLSVHSPHPGALAWPILTSRARTGLAKARSGIDHSRAVASTIQVDELPSR